jgi:glycosyltransferase family protein
MNFRYGKFFHYPRQIIKRILSALYPVVIKIWPLPKVMSIEETIDLILSEKKSIARFGDSEFLYIIDKLNLPYQKYDTELALKLKEILLSDNPEILVGLPSGYHSLENLTQESVVFWRSQISWIYPRLRKYLRRDRLHANASMTRLYIEIKDKTICKKLFSKVRMLWQDRNIVLIEGEKSRLGVGNDLFDNALNVKRILGPATHAFSKFNELLQEAKTQPKNSLILIAMGPTAKPLAYELAKSGFQAIDIGNLDIEYEWYLMGAEEKIKIKGKYTSEASEGRIVEEINDKKYINQIIAKHF